MSSKSEPLAIVGMACRFPGASSPEAFWANLVAGKESIADLTEEMLAESGIAPEVYRRPDYVRRCPIIEGSDEFDPDFFGFKQREAEVLDPQQRVLLHVTHEALNDAGMLRLAKSKKTGVYATAGGSVSSYLFQHAEAFKSRNNCSTGSEVHLANDKDFLATRLSYKFDLTGPAMTVQTACSSSLSALKVAMQALQLGEIDIAIVAASNIREPRYAGYSTEQNHVASPTGHCRPFSTQSDGTLFGSGVGVIVITLLTEAIARQDNIYCELSSCALNNDGGKKVSYTASSMPGQAKAVAEAINRASVEEEPITYIEAHGTATKIGDPLEVRALDTVVSLINKDIKCGLGSVKGNIGHLEQAAGLASIMKVALMLKHKALVPNLHGESVSPRLRLSEERFFIPDNYIPWDINGYSRRVAGVNCLGMGGTNAFAVLKEYIGGESEQGVQHPKSFSLLTLSAKTPEALAEIICRYRDFIGSGNASLAQAATISNQNNSDMAYRYAVMSSDISDALKQLSTAIDQCATLSKTGRIEKARFAYSQDPIAPEDILWAMRAREMNASRFAKVYRLMSSAIRKEACRQGLMINEVASPAKDMLVNAIRKISAEFAILDYCDCIGAKKITPHPVGYYEYINETMATRSVISGEVKQLVEYFKRCIEDLRDMAYCVSPDPETPAGVACHSYRYAGFSVYRIPLFESEHGSVLTLRKLAILPLVIPEDNSQLDNHEADAGPVSLWDLAEKTTDEAASSAEGNARYLLCHFYKKLWLLGADLDFNSLQPLDAIKTVSGPLYPFENRKIQPYQGD